MCISVRACIYVTIYLYGYIYTSIHKHSNIHPTNEPDGDSGLIAHTPTTNHSNPSKTPGFFCVLLSRRRGLISATERDRILSAMRGIGLPTMVPRCSVAMLHKVRASFVVDMAV